MTGIGEAVAAVKSAYVLARSAKDMTDKVKLDTAVNEVLDALGKAQSALLELQQQHFELMNENRKLKDKLKKEERFDDYVLRETPVGGRYILELRSECITPDRPAHAICPLCREDGRLIVMSKNDTHHSCSKCRFSALHSRSQNKSLEELGNELG